MFINTLNLSDKNVVCNWLGYGMTESSPVLLIEPVNDVQLGAAGCVVSNTLGKVGKAL